MFPTVKGIYRDGNIILSEEPPVTSKADVIVTFLTEERQETPKPKRVLGGLEGKISVPDDFNEQ